VYAFLNYYPERSDAYNINDTTVIPAGKFVVRLLINVAGSTHAIQCIMIKFGTEVCFCLPKN